MSFSVELSGFDRTQDSLNELQDFSESATVVISADTEYAVFVEFGTINQEAQPFIRPAVRQVFRNPMQYLDNTVETVSEVIEQLAEAIVERARSKVPVDTGELRNAITVEEI